MRCYGIFFLARWKEVVMELAQLWDVDILPNLFFWRAKWFIQEMFECPEQRKLERLSLLTSINLSHSLLVCILIALKGFIIQFFKSPFTSGKYKLAVSLMHILTSEKLIGEIYGKYTVQRYSCVQKRGSTLCLYICPVASCSFSASKAQLQKLRWLHFPHLFSCHCLHTSQLLSPCILPKNLYWIAKRQHGVMEMPLDVPGVTWVHIQDPDLLTVWPWDSSSFLCFSLPICNILLPCL